MIAPYFHWCSYWGSWSRVLHSPGTKHDNCDLPGYFMESFIEVNLTPVNGWPCDNDKDSYRSYQLDQVRHIIIRCHMTSRGKKDEIWGDLPEITKDALRENIGDELTHRLLAEDFLPQIDFAIYHKHCNGGAKLADILKR